MLELTVADALRLAINGMRDAAEARKMPSGMALDDASVALHAEAAETLEMSLAGLKGHE